MSMVSYKEHFHQKNMAVFISSSNSTTIPWLWLLSFLFLYMSRSCLADGQFNYNLGHLFSRKLCPSCSTRFEQYPFSRHIHLSAAEAQESISQVESQPFKLDKSGHADGDFMRMSTSTNLDKNRRKHKTGIPIGASLSVAAVGMLLVSTLWHMRRGNALLEEQQQNNRETGLLDSSECNTHNENCSYGCLQRQNVPLFPLHRFRKTVTRYFSAESKIRNQMEYQNVPLFPLDVIMEAVNHFSNENKIGGGGFGVVYKGMLPGGELIAVKRILNTSAQAVCSFLKEVSAVSKLQHKNVVRLLGCCIEKDERLLIYEYMANRSLNDVLFGSSTHRGLLEWKTRVSIINGVAKGLSYMHEDSRLTIIHCDIKHGNVLLDDNMNPKISDFGLARINPEYESEEDSTIKISDFGLARINPEYEDTHFAGTLGYIAPECLFNGQVTIKSDVFSFGVLLLEIIVGKKNNMFRDDELGLLGYIWNLWREEKALDLMDPALKESRNLNELMRCIHIGLLCVQGDPRNRPTMSSVVVMLASDDVKLPQPTQPSYFPSGYVSSLFDFESSSNIEDVSILEVSVFSCPSIEGECT